MDKPRLKRNADIRYLDQRELETLLRAVPTDTAYGLSDRALFLTAAMTGLRQGELLALRWSDVDWPASRVRRSYVRGGVGTPKSRRSSRSVPMIDQVARELEHHFSALSLPARPRPCVRRPAHRGRAAPLLPGAAVQEGAEGRWGARGALPRLRHTFGTRMAAVGVPIRTLQEWMGHSDHATTLIYADYAPSAQEAALVGQAFSENDALLMPRESADEAERSLAAITKSRD